MIGHKEQTLRRLFEASLWLKAALGLFEVAARPCVLISTQN